MEATRRELHSLIQQKPEVDGLTGTPSHPEVPGQIPHENSDPRETGTQAHPHGICLNVCAHARCDCLAETRCAAWKQRRHRGVSALCLCV